MQGALIRADLLVLPAVYLNDRDNVPRELFFFGAFRAALTHPGLAVLPVDRPWMGRVLQVGHLLLYQ